MWVILVLASAVGSWISVRSRAGEMSSLWLYATAMASTTAWMRIVGTSRHLPTSAALFDVTCASTYLAVLLVLGERLTPVQGIGAALAIAGVGLMSA